MDPRAPVGTQSKEEKVPPAAKGEGKMGFRLVIQESSQEGFLVEAGPAPAGARVPAWG